MNRSIRAMAMLLLLSATACSQDMAAQPAYRPLRPSSFFVDGQSARPPVPGTIARGAKPASGMRTMDASDWVRLTSLVGLAHDNPLAATQQVSGWSLYQEALPVTMSLTTLQRGQERFNIYCSVCHDRVATGKGMIVQRGFTAPPSLHDDWSRGFKHKGANLKLRDAPVGYYFEVITHGFGAMPAYAELVAPADRWAIIAYIRALQFSQSATLADVRDADERARLTRSQGGRR